MQLSETVKLYPTKYQKELILSAMDEYISVVNHLVSNAVSGFSIAKCTTANVSCNLPSALANQCIRDAKSIVKKHYKTCRATILKNRKRSIKATASRLPVIKKPCCYVNNQNFKVGDDTISFPVLVNGKSKRIFIPAKITTRQKQLFNNAKLGTLRIVIKNNHLVAQIVYEIAETPLLTEGHVMGIDLGIKCPAVSYCSDGSVKFYGNGRKNKYIRRHYKYLRKKLQSSKKPEAVKRIDNKEQRIMYDIDHKLSHDIIEMAIAHNVKTIKLEQLANIRSTTRTSRKNNPSLHTWSFYRLAQFIEYKARLAGISVEYVNPAYTSQRCPICGHIHHANDRNYTCGCGFHLENLKKDNKLISAYMSEDINTQKILLLCLAKIYNLKINAIATNPVIEIFTKEIQKYLGWEQNHYEKIVDAVTNLKSMVIVIFDPKTRSWHFTSIFNDIVYYGKEHRVKIDINTKTLDLLSDNSKKSNFTWLKVSEMAQFKNVKAYRLCEIVKSQSYALRGIKDTGIYKFKIKELDLRLLLGTTKIGDKYKTKKTFKEDYLVTTYKDWKLFKNKALKPAIAENNRISNIQILSCKKIQGTDQIEFITKKLTGVEADIKDLENNSVLK